MSDDLKRMALDAKGPMPRDPSFADPLLMFKDAATPDAILDLFRERDEAAAEITALRASLDAMRQERDEAQGENTRLRAALAVSKSPCVYCQLPAEDMAKCKAWFPGCDRADDMMGCAEFGASMEASEQRTRAEAAEAALSAKDEEIARLREALEPFSRECDGWPDEYSDDENLVESFNGVTSLVTLGDCRRARAALSPRTAAMEHIAQERAEEIEEETR